MDTSQFTPVALPRLDSFNQDCLDLFKDLSVDSLLLRIAQIASHRTNGCYCICGLIGERWRRFTKYSLFGFTPDEISLLEGGHEEAVASLPSDESILTVSAHECRKYEIFPNGGPAVKSILFVPIYTEESRIGSIILVNKIGAKAFLPEDLALMESLSTYAGIALNNAALYKRAEVRERMLIKRNEDLGLLNDLGRIATESDGDAKAVLNQMMDLIIDGLNCEIGEFFLNTEEKPDEYHLVFHSGHSLDGSLLGLDVVQKGEGLLGEAAELNRIHVFTRSELDNINGKNAVRFKLNYMAVLPVSSGHDVLGLMILGARLTRGQEDPENTFLTSITGWIAPLIDNTRLMRQRQKVAILEERERIGMDLHDGVIQSIYGVGLALENASLSAIEAPEKTADTIKIAIEALNATIKDIRSYIMDLKPERLNHENITQSLRRLANDFHANSFVTTDCIIKVEHVEKLSDEQSNMFYMICKEALSNIAKHAHATKVSVTFSEQGSRFVLIVQDNGDGFDTSVDKGPSHHGLGNMASRAESLGGQMEIMSSPGHGTTIIVTS